MRLSAKILSEIAWFFDYDGSLCPHQEVWEERAYEPADIISLVGNLAQRSKAVCWNTGRRVESLASVSPDFLRFSGYFIQGSMHWNAETRKMEQLAPALPAAIRDGFAALLEGHADFRLEEKPTGLRIAPVRLNLLPKLAQLLRANERLLRAGAADGPTGWHWTLGHRGAELLASGFDKGTAIRRELKEGAIPAILGDDILDKPAAAETLRRGGYVILVGDSCGWITELENKPDQLIYCDSPFEAQRFLRSLL